MIVDLDICVTQKGEAKFLSFLQEYEFSHIFFEKQLTNQ